MLAQPHNAARIAGLVYVRDGAREMPEPGAFVDFGQRLKEARKAIGNPSQHTLGVAVGVTNQTVFDWERGAYLPKGEQLIKLAEVLRVSIDWLLLGREPDGAQVERESRWVIERVIRAEKLTGEDVGFLRELDTKTGRLTENMVKEALVEHRRSQPMEKPARDPKKRALPKAAGRRR